MDIFPVNLFTCSMPSMTRPCLIISILYIYSQLRDSPSPVSDTEHIKSKQQTTPESPDGASAAISLHPAGPPQRSSQKHVYPAKNPSKQMTELDWLWLNACEGVIDGNIRPIEGFIVNGGDPSRQITQVSEFCVQYYIVKNNGIIIIVIAKFNFYINTQLKLTVNKHQNFLSISNFNMLLNLKLYMLGC